MKSAQVAAAGLPRRLGSHGPPFRPSLLSFFFLAGASPGAEGYFSLVYLKARRKFALRRLMRNLGFGGDLRRHRALISSGDSPLDTARCAIRILDAVSRRACVLGARVSVALCRTPNRQTAPPGGGGKEVWFLTSVGRFHGRARP
jgi:hypothetical protein